MKAHIVDGPALRAISPQALKAYAVTEGWKPTEAYGGHSQIYVKNGFEIIVPGTSALGDYASVLSDLLGIFAQSEDRDELQVYRDLVSADRDVVRIRSPEADKDGSVRVEAGVDLIVHSRDLVLSAACSAWDPRPTYRAGKIKQADDYMSRVRLGQTEQGSFIVKLLAPVPPALERQTNMWPHESVEPYERRVTRRLADSLDAAANAIESFNLGADITIFHDVIEQGLNANLCQAAANLAEHGNGVDVSITWARTRPAPLARWSRTFSRSDGETLREVARIFHERQPRPDETLEGIIVKLARDENNTDRRVTMKAIVDGRLASVQAELLPEDYNKAIDAHKDNIPISVNGTLERVGRRWHLKNPVNVRRLMEDDIETDESMT